MNGRVARVARMAQWRAIESEYCGENEVECQVALQRFAEESVRFLERGLASARELWRAADAVVALGLISARDIQQNLHALVLQMAGANQPQLEMLACKLCDEAVAAASPLAATFGRIVSRVAVSAMARVAAQAAAGAIEPEAHLGLSVALSAFNNMVTQVRIDRGDLEGVLAWVHHVGAPVMERGVHVPHFISLVQHIAIGCLDYQSTGAGTVAPLLALCDEHFRVKDYQCSERADYYVYATVRGAVDIYHSTPLRKQVENVLALLGIGAVDAYDWLYRFFQTFDLYSLWDVLCRLVTENYGTSVKEEHYTWACHAALAEKDEYEEFYLYELTEDQERLCDGLEASLYWINSDGP